MQPMVNLADRRRSDTTWPRAGHGVAIVGVVVGIVGLVVQGDEPTG
jgi:hypothetical protein